MEEIKEVIPLYSRVDYAQMSDQGVSLGYSHSEGKGSMRFVPVETNGKEPAPSGEYPLLLCTGSVLFHSGTLSLKSPELTQIGPGGWVEVNPADAEAYRLTDGQPATVKSPRGEITVSVKVSKNQAKGTLFVPYHYDTQPAHSLTGKDLNPVFVSIKKG